ncbi:MAG: rod shape-determining protein MreD [Candidatus Aminicenantes bacterium]|nr:rod shape-determining protein MreD [Candidatus Aminicenantes bacterium]
MNNRFRYILLLAMLVGQIAVSRYYQSLRFNVDLLFMIIFYICVKSGFLKSIVSASLIGLISDYLSGGIIGVFSFSRTLAAYFLNTIARFVDLKNNFFIFLLIFISLFFSNAIAFIFFVLIFKLNVTVSLLVYQPFSTAVIGTILLGSKKVKSLLDVS